MINKTKAKFKDQLIVHIGGQFYMWLLYHCVRFVSFDYTFIFVVKMMDSTYLCFMLFQINGLDNHYLFSKKQHNHKTPEETTFETVGLLNDARVIWTQQQFAKHLRKRAEIQELRRQLRAMSQIYRKETEVSKYEGMFTDEWWPMQWYEVTFETHRYLLSWRGRYLYLF
jgi:hypothetical protein